MDARQKQLRAEYRNNMDAIDDAIGRVLMSGRYILGKEVEQFEENFADYVGAKYCVGVGSGYGALCLSYLLLENAKVFVAGERHIASTNAALAANHPVVNNSKEANTIMIVEPYSKYLLGPIYINPYSYILVDACQALDEYRNKEVLCCTPLAASFSFHPLKPLHCYGDGGAIVTNVKKVANRLKVLRNHGRKGNEYSFGINSRLDEIQAAVLNVFLNKRRANEKANRQTK